MDIRTYLAEQGLTKEEIDAVVGNEKTARAMGSALAKFDEGSTALEQAKAAREAADATKKEAEDFWEQKVTPALAGVDGRVARAEAEKAKYATYLKTLKEQGYDVPDDMVNAPARIEAKPEFLTVADAKRQFEEHAPSMVTVVSLSNKYRDLFGSEYLTMDEDFAEARKLNRPFSQHVREKYKFDAKSAEKSQAKETERINALVAEQVKAKEEALVAKYGSNSNISAPMQSKFDKIEGIKERKDSWKSTAGREAARKDRLTKYENLKLQ